MLVTSAFNLVHKTQKLAMAPKYNDVKFNYVKQPLLDVFSSNSKELFKLSY